MKLVDYNKIREISLGDNGSLSIFNNDKEVIIHRFASRGKIDNYISNYEYLDKDNVSHLKPLTLNIANKILDRAEEGVPYSSIYLFYEKEPVSLEMFHEKSEQEHKFTSTGVKFWRHVEQMNSFKAGTGNTVISTHISPEGACNLDCPYCSVTYRDTHSRIELPVIKDYVTKLKTRGLKAIILSGGGEPTIYKHFNELVQWIKEQNLSVALITNGTLTQKLELDTFKAFSWVRVSINLFDKWEERIGTNWDSSLLSDDCVVGCSMVYTVEHEKTDEIMTDRVAMLKKVGKIADRLNAKYIRLLPNCLLDQAHLIAQHESLDNILNQVDDDRFFHQYKIHAAPKCNTCHQAKFRPYLSEEPYHEDNIPGTVYPCVPPNTKVCTSLGFKNIEDIKIGERVLGHDGLYHKVTKLYKRKYKGEMVKIIPTGYSQFPIILTPNHKVLAGQKLDIRFKYKNEFKPSKVITVDNNIGNWFVYSDLQFIPAEKLKKGDILTQTFKSNLSIDTSNINKNKLFVYGLFIAEGHTYITNKSNQINFTLHEDEIEIKNKLISILEKEFGLSVNVYSRDSKSVRINCSSKFWASFFEEKFGKYCYNKKAPFEWLNLPKDILESLVLGICSGDGGFTNNKFSYITTSKDLFDFLRLSFIKLTIPFHTSIRSSRTPKDGITRRTAYLINSSSEKIKNIMPFVDVVYQPTKHNKSHKIWIENDSIIYTIKNIEKIQSYNDYVYNLEVEDCHSYVLEGGVVKNCDSVVLNSAYQFFAKQYQLCRAADILDFLDDKIKADFNPSKHCEGCVFTENVNMLDDWKNKGVERFAEFSEPLEHEEFV